MNESKRILLVEDHDDTRAMTAHLLRKRGYEIVVASTKAEAAMLCEHGQFDLLICDLQLPDGSGLDLMRELAAKCGIKGIAYTAYGYEADIASTMEAGFFAHIVKPIDVKALLETIEEVLAI